MKKSQSKKAKIIVRAAFKAAHSLPYMEVWISAGGGTFWALACMLARKGGCNAGAVYRAMSNSGLFRYLSYHYYQSLDTLCDEYGNFYDNVKDLVEEIEARVESIQ